MLRANLLAQPLRYEYERNNNFYTLPFNSSFSRRLVIFNLLNIVRTLVCGLGFVLVSFAPCCLCMNHLDAAALPCAMTMVAKKGCSWHMQARSRQSAPT